MEAAVTELGLAEEWYGKFNRESQTLPVLDLRESVIHLGLLRRYKGTLLATPRARKLADPIALWWHLAEHLPPPKITRPETHASLLLEAATAAGPRAAPNPLYYVAMMLGEAGHSNTGGTRITDDQARQAAADTHAALHRLARRRLSP